MFKEKEFDYQIQPGWIVGGIVSGELIRGDEEGPDEVKNFRLDARVYYGEEDEKGTPYHEAIMSDEMKEEIEEAAVETLWEEEFEE